LFERVVFPLDLQESDQSIRFSIAVLSHLSSRVIHLVHVTESGLDKASHRREQLEKIGDKLQTTGFQTEVEIRAGHVATAISRLSDQADARLIAMPWNKRTILQRTLFGSVTTDVIRLAEHPVLISKQKFNSVASDPLNTVLYATAFETTDREAMPYIRYPGLQADTLYLLHVAQRAPDPAAEKLRKQQVEQKLDNMAQECSDQYRYIEKLAAIGSARRQIVRQAKRHDVDLIVIGKYDKGDPLQKMTGSTAQHLAHKSPCSLLVIPRVR